MGKQDSGTVSAVMVREALVAPLQQGWLLEDLLEGTPFDQRVMAQDAERVSVKHYARFWRRLRRTIQDEFFLMDPRSMRPGSLPLCRAWLHSSPLSERGWK